MAGAFSFLLGLFGLGAAAGIRTVQNGAANELLDYHTELYSYRPNQKERAVYEKWRLEKYNPRRKEWMYKVPGHEHDHFESRLHWWEHIYEDEGVPVDRRYLLIISGMAHRMFLTKACELKRSSN